jgi:diguanylate cyclase (GGDEF)-like protein
MNFPTEREEDDEADAAALAFGPAIVGLTYHFADEAVERRFGAAMANQGRRRLTALCWVALLVCLSRLAAPLLGLIAGSGSRLSLAAQLAQMAICIVVLALLRRQRSSRMLEILGALFGASYVAITCFLLPGMAEDGSVAMVIGTIALLLVALPVRLPLLAPASIVASALMLFAWGSSRPAPSRLALFQALEWLIVVNLLGLTAVRMMRLTLRRQFALTQALRHLATHDALTGIANRRRYDQFLARQWGRCRDAGQPLSLVLLDVDFFKLLNDRIGHAAGDDCLRELARLLARCVDPATSLVARTGGEEFACVLPDASAEDALELATCITTELDTLGMPHPHSPLGPHITVSLGVATAYPAQGMALRDLTALADRLVYEAKAEGRACLRAQVLGSAEGKDFFLKKEAKTLST